MVLIARVMSPARVSLNAEMRHAARFPGPTAALEHEDIAAAGGLRLDEICLLADGYDAEDALVERERPPGILDGQRDVGQAVGLDHPDKIMQEKKPVSFRLTARGTVQVHGAPCRVRCCARCSLP